MEKLMAYDWPGNVRELENAVERAVVLSRGLLITADHLPFGDAREARDRARLSARTHAKSSQTDASSTNANGKAGSGAASSSTDAVGDDLVTETEGGAVNGSFKTAVAELEKRLILEALDRAGGNRSKAAEELGIYRRLLYAKLREYGLGD
jgi:DNA-binding NtrC family response regulator